MTFGIAVGLGRTPPPPLHTEPSPVELAIGYGFDGPPTVARVFFDWRFDLIFGTAAIVMAVLYVLGVRRLRGRGDAWPMGRTLAWMCGCAALLFTTSSGLGRYMPAMFSMHMVAHMMLSMLVPILLVLGAPMTLALRALPTAGRGEPPGPREWLLAALHSRVSRFLTNPIVATVVFVAGFYGLYLGGVFDAAVSNHAAHVLMNVHFLLSGYLFYWVVIGIDPTPRQIPQLGKVAMVFASLPLHAFFGVVLMGMDTVLGETFYRSLLLSWHTDLIGDQRLGGGIAWAAGEVPLVLVMIALLIQWRRSDQRTAKRLDRAADRDDDAELAAYNAMLAKLAQAGRPLGHSARLGQSRDGACEAQRVLIGVEVVARDFRVHGTFEKETQHRVICVIRLVEREHRCAVGLFLEFVIAVGARPQRRADRDVPRQLVELAFGHRFKRPPLAPRQQILGHLEDAGADKALSGLVAFMEDLHAARGPFEDPRSWRVRRHRGMQHAPHPSRRCIDVESHGVGLHQCYLLFAQALIGVSRKVMLSAGGREAGRKSVPIV